MADWYERRDELEEGQVFRSCWGIVRLDHRVPGDGTDWVVQSWYGSSFAYDESRIHPNDLTERLPDNFAGEAA